MIDERGASGLELARGKSQQVRAFTLNTLPPSGSSLVDYSKTHVRSWVLARTRPCKCRRISCQEEEGVERLTKMEKTCKKKELGQ
jgi:hypothetical protein